MQEISKHEQPAMLASLVREKIAGYGENVQIYINASKNSDGSLGIGCFVKETPCAGEIKHLARVTHLSVYKRLRGRARRHTSGVLVSWSTEVVVRTNAVHDPLGFSECD
jgi:hypothetical protein